MIEPDTCLRCWDQFISLHVYWFVLRGGEAKGLCLSPLTRSMLGCTAWGDLTNVHPVCSWRRSRWVLSPPTQGCCSTLSPPFLNQEEISLGLLFICLLVTFLLWPLVLHPCTVEIGVHNHVASLSRLFGRPSSAQSLFVCGIFLLSPLFHLALN